MRYTVKAAKFFSEEERSRIKEATRGAESRTIGEIVVMVVDSSDLYREAEVFGGVLTGGLCSFIISAVFLDSSVWSFIPLAFFFFFPSRLIFRMFPALKVAFITRRRIEEAVRQRAFQVFYEKGLYRTKMNTGVLFFLSLLERKVWVLADRGIYEKIDQETLNGFAEIVTRGIGHHRGCDALCEAIGRIGEALARHFPKTGDDTDELPDDVMT
jgi:putative membrane protein